MNDLMQRTRRARLATMQSRTHTREEKFAEGLAHLLLGTLILAFAWGFIVVMAAVFTPAEAQEPVCVEDAMNRPGRDGAYPTGCFVKPVPVEQSNCISWNNIGPNKVCTNYRDGAERELDAADSYKELGPKLDQDEILNTADGPCKRRNWSLYLGKCSKVEDTVTVPESDVFHPNGQMWKEHLEASRQCHAINAWLLESYNWFLSTLGAEHGLTQLYKYSLEASLRGCAG